MSDIDMSEIERAILERLPYDEDVEEQMKEMNENFERKRKRTSRSTYGSIRRQSQSIY